jgi:hypothetical protein
VLGRVALAALGVEVAGHHACSGLRQSRRQRAADLAEPDHADAAAVELVRAVPGGQAAAHRAQHGLRGHRRRVAPASVLERAAGAEAGEAAEVVHVGGGGADVLGGDVRAAERLDHTRGRLHARETLLGLPIVEHDRLAAAEVEPGRGRLERHRAGQALDVVERLAQAAGIGLQAHAAERRAEHGGVHGHDQAHATGGVLLDDDLLETAAGARGNALELGNGHGH